MALCAVGDNTGRYAEEGGVECQETYNLGEHGSRWGWFGPHLGGGAGLVVWCRGGVVRGVLLVVRWVTCPGCRVEGGV